METLRKQIALHRCALIRRDLDILSTSTNNQNIRKKINTVLRALLKLQQSILTSNKDDWYE